jgi:hypothetical protein
VRTWGRISDGAGGLKWVEVSTAANGDNSAVYITWLIQVLKLNLNESPFYADWGIPGYPAVAQQVPPDHYVQLTQQRFAQYFASLVIARVADNPPTYSVNLLTKQGAALSLTIPT